MNYVLTDGILSVSSGYKVHTTLRVFEPVKAAGSVVTRDLDLPVDARVEQVAFTVSAEPSGLTTIGSVATVRAATPVSTAAEAACTIDFGALVTVGGIGATTQFSPSISAVYRWTGSTWFALTGGAAFAEAGTDRLLVETTSDLTGDEFTDRLLAANGVHLPAVPSALELVVDGVTVWFERQGSVAGSSVTPPDGGVAYRIDRTDLVRQAFERASVVSGVKTVRVTLRSATPGTLELQSEISSLRVHTVQFPPHGLATTVDLASEGPVSFDISPPASAKEVAEVSLTVRGSFGPDRVQPPLGPALEPSAALALVVGRPILLGIPATLASRFGRNGKFSGIRLWLRTFDETAEVAGRLLADIDETPGDPLPGSDLVALPLPSNVDSWHTLNFVEPVELPEPGSAVAAWVELQLSYGTTECALTLASPTDITAPGAPLLRRLPGGGTDELTTVPAIGVLRAAIRLVGTPDREHPIPAVTLSVPRSATEIGVTPNADDLLAVLGLARPVVPTGTVELAAVAAAAGSLTVDTVRVAYREGTPT